MKFFAIQFGLKARTDLSLSKVNDAFEQACAGFNPHTEPLVEKIDYAVRLDIGDKTVFLFCADDKLSVGQAKRKGLFKTAHDEDTEIMTGSPTVINEKILKRLPFSNTGEQTTFNAIRIRADRGKNAITKSRTASKLLEAEKNRICLFNRASKDHTYLISDMDKKDLGMALVRHIDRSEPLGQFLLDQAQSGTDLYTTVKAQKIWTRSPAGL